MLGIFQSLGAPGLILVLVVLLALFGDRRLPDLARSIGTSSREFKRGLKEPEPQQPGVTAPPAGTRDA